MCDVSTQQAAILRSVTLQTYMQSKELNLMLSED